MTPKEAAAFLGHQYPSRFKQNYQFNKARLESAIHKIGKKAA